ncbi:MAG: AraC family transcriptional regulator [Cytophagales bacterium]
MEEIREINIKGMVCNRCIYTIRELFLAAGYSIKDIRLGKVIFDEPLKQEEKAKMNSMLNGLGFQLLSDRNELALIKIKQLITEWTELNSHGERVSRLSDFLSGKMNQSYDVISDLFSKYEGKSIEKYFIEQRIEKAKELLAYTQLSLSEIAFKCGFSSPYHLSGQFKHVTGMNPSALRSNDAHP